MQRIPKGYIKAWSVRAFLPGHLIECNSSSSKFAYTEDFESEVLVINFNLHVILLVPSRVSGWGYKIGPVCLCVRVSVCLSVSELSRGWTVWPRTTKSGTGIDLDNISAKFDGQGHRSKVKVARLKNVIFRLFPYGVTYVDCTNPFCHDILRQVTSRHDIMTSQNDASRDVTAWRLDILLWLLGKNTDKGGTSREGASTLRRFH